MLFCFLGLVCFQTNNRTGWKDNETQTNECETNCSFLDRTCSTIWWRTFETAQYASDMVAILLLGYTGSDSHHSHFDSLFNTGFVKTNSENYSEKNFAQGACKERMMNSSEDEPVAKTR